VIIISHCINNYFKFTFSYYNLKRHKNHKDVNSFGMEFKNIIEFRAFRFIVITKIVTMNFLTDNLPEDFLSMIGVNKCNVGSEKDQILRKNLEVCTYPDE